MLLIEGSAAAATDAPPHRGRRLGPVRGSDGEDAPSVGVGGRAGGDVEVFHSP